VSLRIRTTVGALTIGVLVAVPAAAHAAVKTVYMGPPAAAEKVLNEKLNADVNDFFPHSISVHVGEKVRFVPVGFHTVDMPARGSTPLPLISPTGSAVANVLDAAGNPFWFNGRAQVGFNPLLGKGLFGTTAVYTTRTRVDSGLPLSNHPKSFNVRFTKAGTYTYYCNVHPGMKGVVHVRSATSRVPTVAADKLAVKRQIASAEKAAKRITATVPPTGTVFVGGSAAHGVESYAFYPSTVTVPVGTTLTFRMSPASLDVHTATTGPGNPESEPASYLGTLAATFEGGQVLDPRAVYPSDPAPLVPSLTPTAHGNGFWNAGMMDNSAATPLLNNSGTVRFDAAGTYQFYCLIHPFMHATVTVQ